jgi:hypothetical protein
MFETVAISEKFLKGHNADRLGFNSVPLIQKMAAIIPRYPKMSSQVPLGNLENGPPA